MIRPGFPHHWYYPQLCAWPDRAVKLGIHSRLIEPEDSRREAHAGTQVQSLKCFVGASRVARF
jgi:hypothetical protein